MHIASGRTCSQMLRSCCTIVRAGTGCTAVTRALFCAVTAATTSSGWAPSLSYTRTSAPSPEAASGSTVPMLHTTGFRCRLDLLIEGMLGLVSKPFARMFSTSPVNMWRTFVWSLSESRLASTLGGRRGRDGCRRLPFHWSQTGWNRQACGAINLRNCRPELG